GDEAGKRQREQVVVALEVMPVRRARLPAVEAPGEAFTAVVGLLQAVALDHGAHCPVDHQDALGQRGLQPRHAPRMEPGKAAHGLPAISETTSKCGGRFSRVTVSQDCSARPALSTKRRSSLSVKPRLMCPKASTAARWPWRARLVSSRRPPGRSTRAASVT